MEESNKNLKGLIEYWENHYKILIRYYGSYLAHEMITDDLKYCMVSEMKNGSSINHVPIIASALKKIERISGGIFNERK